MKTKLLSFFVVLFLAVTATAQYAYFPFDTNVLDQEENIQSIASPAGISFVEDEERGDVVYFDGIDGYISLGGNAFNFDALTYNIWFNWTTEVQFQWWTRLFDFGIHVDNDPPAERNVLFVALFAFNDLMQMNIHSAGWEPGMDSVLTSLDPIELNKWYMFTYTHDADGAQLYLDGVLQNEIEFDNFPPSAMSEFEDLWLGRANWPDPLFTGMMDEFTIWDRVLTEAEILELYGDPTFVKPLESRNALIYSFANNLRIELPTYQDAYVEVYSLTGSLVYRQENLGHMTDVRGLETGLYIVKVINNNQMTTQKVIIQQPR
jgi:hypothetical protein